MKQYNNLHISGIYCIRNKTNNKGYIGSAVNIQSRINTHISHLRRKIHHSQYLQNSFIKYGEENFTYFVLATCPKEYLIKLEQWFIDNLKPEYNMAPKAGSTLGYKATLEQVESNRQRQLGKKWTKESIDKRNSTVRKILYQYDLKGNFIKEFKGVRETGDLLNIPWQAIINCCSDKPRNKQAGEFQWRYYKVDKLPKIEPRKRYKKRLIQYNLNNIKLKEYDSALAASKNLNINYGNLCNAAKSNKKLVVGNYRWSYDNSQH